MCEQPRDGKGNVRGSVEKGGEEIKRIRETARTERFVGKIPTVPAEQVLFKTGGGPLVEERGAALLQGGQK